MKNKKLTSSSGVPVADNQNMITSGKKVRFYFDRLCSH
jgi:hypothetical protein